MSNSLDPDQAQHFVGPDLGPNCLQKFSADNTRRQKINEKVSGKGTSWHICPPDPDQPAYLQSLIRVFVGRSMVTNSVDPNEIMLHFIWVFNVFKSTCLRVSLIQRVKEPISFA